MATHVADRQAGVRRVKVMARSVSQSVPLANAKKASEAVILGQKKKKESLPTNSTWFHMATVGISILIMVPNSQIIIRFCSDFKSKPFTA